MDGDLLKALQETAKKHGLECAWDPESQTVSIAHYTVLLYQFKHVDTREEALQCVEQATERASQCRSHLNPSSACDLNLFLTAPNSDIWKDVATEVERDDRVCRKLVWLHDQETGEASSEFLQRTFLAHPWEVAIIGDQEALGRLSQKLDISERWLHHLRDPALEGGDLIETLMDDLEGSSLEAQSATSADTITMENKAASAIADILEADQPEEYIKLTEHNLESEE